MTKKNNKKEEKKKINIAIWIIIFIVVIVLTLLFVYLISPYRLELNGDGEITISYKSNYEEQGAVVKRFIFVTNKPIEVEDDIDTNKKGDYKVTYKADTLTLTRIVHVVDNEPPKVIIDEDKQTLVLNLNGDVDKFKDIHFFDEADELIENVDEEDNIDITTIGDYTIKYHACDTSNNCVDYEREVEVKDLEPPVIKLNKGNLTLTVGKNYQEYGATAKDNSGDVQAINIDNKVDTSKEGVYEVKYTVCDLSNNCAEKIRTVTVKKEELISGTFKSHPTIDGTIPSTLTLNSTTKKATFVINQCEGMDSISGTYKVSGNTITVTLSRAINEKYKTIKFTKINNDTLKMNTDIMSCAPSGKNEKYSRS